MQFNFAVSDDIQFHRWTNLNFDEEFAEPIIKFVLISDIQNLSIDMGNYLTRAIYTRKDKTRTVPFIRVCLI